ncbi:hypothetical protein V8E55_007483 [Tylopilus felleus]
MATRPHHKCMSSTICMSYSIPTNHTRRTSIMCATRFSSRNASARFPKTIPILPLPSSNHTSEIPSTTLTSNRRSHERTTDVAHHFQT